MAGQYLGPAPHLHGRDMHRDASEQQPLVGGVQGRWSEGADTAGTRAGMLIPGSYKMPAARLSVPPPLQGIPATKTGSIQRGEHQPLPALIKKVQ
eukprot:1155728-Pelagomonas_calceolata.AAC.13